MILSIRKQREEAVRRKTVHWRARVPFPYSGQQAPSPDPIHDIYPATLYSFTSTEPLDPWNHHRPSQSFSMGPVCIPGDQGANSAFPTTTLSHRDELPPQTPRTLRLHPETSPRNKDPRVQDTLCGTVRAIRDNRPGKTSSK